MALIPCDSCFNPKPHTEFSDLTTGAICNDCRTGQASASLDKVLKEKVLAASAELEALDPDAVGPETAKVRTVISEIYKNFGGITGFAAQVHHVAMELATRRPMPAAAGQLLLQLLKIHQNQERNEVQISALEMSDEQLKRQENIELTRMFMDALGDSKKREGLEKLLKRNGYEMREAAHFEAIDAINEMIEEADEPADSTTDGDSGREGEA